MAQKVTHIDHLEDLPLLYGSKGFKRAVTLLNDLVNNKSKLIQNISVKFDGAPSIVAGVNPENGRFFVGTKSVFSKTAPKLLYTLRDIKREYSAQQDLAVKLAEALLYLKGLGWKKVYQGEFLFSSNSKSIENIEGQDYVVFKPQLITYATPLSTDLGQQINRAKVGFVWHTTYDGDSMSDLTQRQGVNSAELGSNPNVWQISNQVQDHDQVINRSSGLNDLVKKLSRINVVAIDRLIAEKTLQSLIMMYVNKLVGENKHFADTNIQDFADYATTKIMADANTDRKRASRQEKLDQVLDHLNLHQAGYTLLQELYSTLSKIKQQVMKKLQSFGGLDAYLRQGDQLEPFSQEGLSVYDKQGNLVKFVDRHEFSRINRITPKDFR